MPFFCIRLWSISLLLTLHGPLLGGDESTPAASEPVVARASADAESQIASFKIPDAWSCRVFAAEPDVANPVVFTVDSQGRIFVCESFRQNQGVTDNRGHDKKWLMADLAAQTVADRIAYHRALLGDELIHYEKQIDRIRVLVDRDRDGRADESKVLVSGFNRLEEGTGAGILVRGSQIYYTCIPRLWLFEDNDFDGVSDKRQVLADGFGVRVAFRGHDMHGLIMGYDGRIYFSIGDRGYHVETPKGLLADPESGAVFRCEPDGSQLEVVATGLRNPQELAFDDYGNWFTCDNNSDSGDEARWTVIAPGGDSGWRMMYQYLPDRGPFNQEDIWHPFHAESPAYIIPPIANFSDGPSGLTFYPGTGLGEAYRGTFFLCDFRGQASNSGIRSLKLNPKGAFFEIASEDQPIWNLLATDVEFGPDGSLYVSDWVNGWNGEGKGRLYRFWDESASQSPEALTAYAILQRGTKQASESSLLVWMSHPDRRVRLESQWELASRQAINALAALAKDAKASELARIHALWGLGQIARRNEGNTQAIDALVDLLSESGMDSTSLAGESNATESTNRDCEWTAVLLTMISEAPLHSTLSAEGFRKVEQRIGTLVEHSSPRIRYAAAMAVGRMKLDSPLEAIIRMLEKNADQDPMIRHAGIMAFTGRSDLEPIAELSKHSSVSVRLSAVVALRKRADRRIDRFLDDRTESVLLEATRAIHDVPALQEGLSKLTRLTEHASQNEAILRRGLNAHFRLGQSENAAALASFAANERRPTSMRLEALRMLQAWSEPGKLDRVMNRYAPLEPRGTESVAEALERVLGKLLSGELDVKKLTREVAAEIGIKAIAPELKKVIEDKNAPGAERSSALLGLVRLQDSEIGPIARRMVDDPSPAVRVSAMRIVLDLDTEAALAAARKRIHSEVVFERQASWEIVGKIKNVEADTILREGVARYLRGSLPQDCWLEVKEASANRLDEELKVKLEKHEMGLRAKAAEEPTAAYQDCVVGGDASKGRILFFERSQLSCLRCHEVGDDGGDVGPKLTEIGIKKNADYLLEAIVSPNAKLAEGFETIIIQTDDGEVVSGILKSQDEQSMIVLKPDGTTVSVDKESIEGTKKGLSSMPNDLLKYLDRRELRDLVAYLASLNGKEVKAKNAKKPKGHGRK